MVVGKTTEQYFISAIDEYTKRVKRYLSFDIAVIPELKNAKNLSFGEQKEKEGEAILHNISNDDFIVLLDEKGKEMTSMEFSSYISNKMNTVSKRLVFIVGGPYGFSDSVYNIAREKISLSKMTFSHQMIRLFFVEQLYRALSILKGSPYHHE